MHPDIRKLLAVQKVDAELARVQRDLDSLPIEERRRRESVEQVRAACEKARDELNHAKVRSRENEVSIKSADEEIKKLEGRLNIVKNNAEYQATLFQIEAVRKERSALEEEGLAFLDGLEGMRESVRELEERLSAEEAAFAVFEREAAVVRDERASERDRIAAGRGKLVDGVPPELLQKYRTLFAVRDGLAVCAVEGSVCTGCYTSITPNDMARLLGATSIVQCGSCNRLLYLAES